jgi:hypothetical protein
LRPGRTASAPAPRRRRAETRRRRAAVRVRRRPNRCAAEARWSPTPETSHRPVAAPLASGSRRRPGTGTSVATLSPQCAAKNGSNWPGALHSRCRPPHTRPAGHLRSGSCHPSPGPVHRRRLRLGTAALTGSGGGFRGSRLGDAERKAIAIAVLWQPCSARSPGPKHVELGKWVPMGG